MGPNGNGEPPSAQVTIDGSGPRRGKTTKTLERALEYAGEDPSRIVIILPMVGDPLEETGLAHNVHEIIQWIAPGTPVAGRFGAQKMCPRFHEGGSRRSGPGQESTRCETCPHASDGDGTHSAAARTADQIAASGHSFWVEAWDDLVQDEPVACPRDVGRVLAGRDRPHVFVTSAQSFRGTSGPDPHPTIDAVQDGVRNLTEGRIVIFDECHHLEAFMEFQRTTIEGAGTPRFLYAAELREAVERLDEDPYGPLEAPDPAADLSEAVRDLLGEAGRWLTRAMYDAVCLYRVYDPKDDLGDEPGLRSWREEHGTGEQLPIHLSRRLKQKPGFLERVHELVAACTYREACLICTAREEVGQALDTAAPSLRLWKDMLDLLWWSSAGEIEISTVPETFLHSLAWFRSEEEDPEPMWGFTARVLDAEWRGSDEAGAWELYPRHTALRTMAQHARELHLLSATQPTEATWRAVLGARYPGEIVYPHDEGAEQVRVLIELATRGKLKLAVQDEAWSDLIEPLLEHEPFVVARSKEEYRAFLRRDHGYPREYTTYARSQETEGVPQDHPYVLMLGPPWRPPTVKEALFMAPLDEHEDDPWHEANRRLNDVVRAEQMRSLVEPMFQAAARTGHREEGGTCVVLGCYPEQFEDLQEVAPPWATLLPLEVPGTGKLHGSTTLKDRVAVIEAFLRGWNISELTPRQWGMLEELSTAIEEERVDNPFRKSWLRDKLRGRTEYWTGAKDRQGVLDWAEKAGIVQEQDSGMYEFRLDRYRAKDGDP